MKSTAWKDAFVEAQVKRTVYDLVRTIGPRYTFERIKDEGESALVKAPERRKALLEELHRQIDERLAGCKASSLLPPDPDAVRVKGEIEIELRLLDLEEFRSTSLAASFGQRIEELEIELRRLLPTKARKVGLPLVEGALAGQREHAPAPIDPHALAALASLPPDDTSARRVLDAADAGEPHGDLGDVQVQILDHADVEHGEAGA